MAIIAGEAISRVRNSIKAVKEDPFMTDRFIYSLITKYGKSLMHREARTKNLFKNSFLFKEIPCFDLKEVDAIEACCTDLKTGCTFMRSVEKLPKILELNSYPAIRNITTIDYSKSVNLTQPSLYINMTKIPSFKYNKNVYGWIVDDYLFIADVMWENVRLQLIPEGDLSKYQCHLDGTPYNCKMGQELEIPILEYLFSEIENMIRQELLTAVQIPSDGADDSQNVLR